MVNYKNKFIKWNRRIKFFDLKSKDEIICLWTKYYKKWLFMNSEIYNHDSWKKEISWPKTKK